MSDEEEHQLLMPFVSVASQGGPYDDDAYTAGFEAGQFWGRLAVESPRTILCTIRTDNVPQFDLMAMHYGYTMVAYPCEDGWSHVEMTKAEDEL